MSIEPFFDTKIYIEKGTLICSFISNGKELTELRGLLFIKEMTAIMEKISTIKINKVVFLFDVDKIVLPYNYKLLKSYAQVFKDHKSVIENKLGFTIIKSESNIFRMFIKLFKKFYTPIKPLYLCSTIEESLECIHNEEKLKELLKFDIKQLE